jgi:autotransporter translocation and assembly factor TamB
VTEHQPEPVYQPPSSSPQPRPLKPGWRKAGRVLWIAFLSVLGFLLLAIASAIVWLHTGTGEEELGRFVTHEARNSIKGDLKITQLRISGFLDICAVGVELRDPENHKVLAAERVCVHVQPLALKAHNVVFSRVLLEKPWLEIAAIPGTKETTLSRALAPRQEVKQPAGSPLAWVIEVRDLRLLGGTVALRPALGAPASFALGDLHVSEAHAKYAQQGADAGLKLTAQLEAPGQAPIALDLEATVDGAVPTGKVGLKALRLKLGESGLAAAGSWDIARQAGEVHLRELALLPKDLAALMPARVGPPVLSSPVRGEADLKSDGKTAQLELRLEGGGGKAQAKVTAVLEKVPEWDLQLAVDGVNPGALSAQAPRGEMSARAALHGKGTPQFDAHGVRGELGGTIHLGPAQLERAGSVVADLKADLHGRYAIVKAFSATALGLEIKAHGAAAYDEISLDLDVQAPSLAEVGRAVGAVTHRPSLPVSGSTRLQARLTGSPQRPDAQVHLRAPSLRWGKTVVAEGLAVDGLLQGPLDEPDGSLKIAARRLSAGSIDLGSPRVDMGLEWPVAHLRIDAGVSGGALELAGDATIDDDKDGLVLSNFTVAYPGNQLRMARSTNVHLRDQVVVEPLELVGDHGSLRFSAQVEPAPGRIEAAVVVTRFELDRLPQFALPKDLGLHGVVDANAVLQGPRASPDLDVHADVRGAGARRAGELQIDAHTHAHLHGGRLKTDGWIASPGVLRFEFEGDLPISKFADQPPSTPLQIEAQLSQVDLAKLADATRLPQLQKLKLHGGVESRIVATGTLGAPRATLSFDLLDVGNEKIQNLDARLGVLVEKGRAGLDGTVSLGGSPALGFTAQAPFDLGRALKEPAYLRGALERSLKAEVAVTQLQLERLVKAGLLPEGSAGTVSLTARLNGMPSRPELQIISQGENVSVGRLHGLGFQGELAVSDKVKLTVGAQSQGVVVAHLEAGAALSGPEILELLGRRDEPDAIAPLLDRSVSLALEIPGLPIARASQLAGKAAVAEGKITGRASLSGTAARPRLVGQLTLRDVTSRQRKLGGGDFYLEADAAGALVHLAIDPPGGGNFLGHARLEADLGARTLLRSGVTSVLDGQLSGEVKSNHLDLEFLSGLLPNVRRTRGTLDADVKMAGLLAKPTAQGEAHLAKGLFDVVGQGVYEDVGLDATFSPREVVIDRLTGSIGTGTFSAILVASRNFSKDPSQADKLEYTGEVHLGDAESVRGRKLPDGKPLAANPVPVRQAGERRADVSGELDVFGDYTDNLLTLNAKIPDALVLIRGLPDKKLPGLKPNPDIVLVHPGERPHPPGMEPEEVEAEAKARKEATFRLHAHLDVNQLYVKAADFEFPVESNLNFDWAASNPDEPTADGTVHVPTGSFTALQRRFTIDDAKIVETGDDIEDPELDIKARFENAQAHVVITISGTAKQPNYDMSSVPPMDQDAIAFFLATGRVQGRATQSGGGVDLSGAASSVLGGILFGQLRKELADVLPVDVLTIETGARGVSEASVGKYIGDRLFIGYRQKFAPSQTENSVEGHVEYEISKSVSAEATVGDKTKDLSVLFTKDF